MVLGVAAGVHGLQAASPDGKPCAILKYARARRGRRDNLTIEAVEGVFAVYLHRTCNQPAGVNKVACAPRVDQKFGLWELLQIKPGSTRVVEMHMGGHDVANLAVFNREVFKRATQIAQAVVGPGFYQGVFAVVAKQIKAGNAGFYVTGINADNVAGQRVKCLRLCVTACGIAWRIGGDGPSPVSVLSSAALLICRHLTQTSATVRARVCR